MHKTLCVCVCTRKRKSNWSVKQKSLSLCHTHERAHIHAHTCNDTHTSQGEWGEPEAIGSAVACPRAVRCRRKRRRWWWRCFSCRGAEEEQRERERRGMCTAYRRSVCVWGRARMSESMLFTVLKPSSFRPALHHVISCFESWSLTITKPLPSAPSWRGHATNTDTTCPLNHPNLGSLVIDCEEVRNGIYLDYNSS